MVPWSDAARTKAIFLLGFRIPPKLRTRSPMAYPFALRRKSRPGRAWPMDLIRRPRPCTLPPPVATQRDHGMAEVLAPEHFLPHVKKVFRVKDGRHALTLASIEMSDSKDASR